MTTAAPDSVPAAAPEVVLADASEGAKAPKKERAPKKEKAPPAKAVAASDEGAPKASTEAPVESEVVVAQVVMTQVTVASTLAEFDDMFQKIAALISGAKGKFKSFEKLVNREIKVAKKTRKIGNSSSAGFVIPCRISAELAGVLGLDPEVEITRVSAYKELVRYIKENSLQDPANGRKVIPDEKLVAALNLNLENVASLTYFTIQKFLKQHLTEIKGLAETADQLPCETCTA